MKSRRVVKSKLITNMAIGATIRDPLWPYVYLASLWRYGASKIMGSRPWPFEDTWRHRSPDHSTRSGRLPMGGPLRSYIYLAPLWWYEASNVGRTHRWTLRWFSNAMHCIGQTI